MELIKIAGAEFDLDRATPDTQRQYRVAKFAGEQAVKSNDPRAATEALTAFEAAQAAVVAELGADALLKAVPRQKLFPDGSVHPAKMRK